MKTNHTNQIFGIILLLVLVLSLSFAISEDYNNSNNSSSFKNKGECVKEAAHLKNFCYNLTKVTNQECRAQVKEMGLKSKNKTIALKQCTEAFKTTKRVCMAEYKNRTTECKAFQFQYNKTNESNYQNNNTNESNNESLEVYKQCSNNSSYEKNICLKEIKSLFDDCKEQVREQALKGKQRKVNLRECTDSYDEAKKNCMTIFKESKNICVEPEETEQEPILEEPILPVE